MLQVKKSLFLICIPFLFTACTSDEELIPADTLQTYLQDKPWELGAVIACAASDTGQNELYTFFYPEAGATDIRYFESSGIEINSNDLNNYSQIEMESFPVFNGYLRRFITAPTEDRWIVVSLFLDDTIRVSNPIRSKLFSKPTLWNGTVDINQTNVGSPTFSWEDNSTGDNAIYFQVVSDSTRTLLSGTYTYENTFTYYDLSNVVLNVTTTTPPLLESSKPYNFTLMDVSEDNWVNLVAEESFQSR